MNNFKLLNYGSQMGYWLMTLGKVKANQVQCSLAHECLAFLVSLLI